MRGRFALVRDFALRSLVMILLFAGVLGVVSAWFVRGALVQASNRAVRTPVEAVVRADVSDAEFANPLGGETLSRLDSDLRRDFLGADVVALKVFDSHRVVIYSTMPGEVGRLYPPNEGLTAAVAGRVNEEVEQGGEAESAGVVRAFGPVVEAYAPIYSRDSHELLGVYEVYQRYGPLSAVVNWTVGVIWSVIVLASCIIYAAQIGIVRGAEQRMRSSEAELVETNGRLEESQRELQSHAVGTLQAFVAAVDAKDSYTAGHSLAVADCAVAIGRRLRLAEDELTLLEKASLLHDMGKIGVPEQILLKKDPLEPKEIAAIREHAEIGAGMVASVPFLADVVPVIRHHHERWDGGGYPDGLKGEDIPLLARILAVADSFHAMSSDRPYRDHLKWFRVRQQLRRNSGTQFDPSCVAALLEALRAGEIRELPHELEIGALA